MLSFRYGDETIAVERVLRQQRKQSCHRITIKVYPDGRVVVSAPAQASDEEVMKATQNRSRWIYQQLSRFRHQNKQMPSRHYISGESHYYLGKQYLLKVIETSEQPQGVKLLRGQLLVTCRQKSAEKVKALLHDWYKVRAKEVFAKRLEAMMALTVWVNDVPPLRILTMRTQWGNCSSKGRIALNLHLIKAARECIDYVILHELCHIAEHNHSPRFYRLLASVMPEWPIVKRELDSRVHHYIAI